MTERPHSQQTFSSPGRWARVGVIVLAAAVLATLMVAVQVLPLPPGLPKLRAAEAATPAPARMCYDRQVTGAFNTSADTASFKLFVPTNASVTVTGSIDMLEPSYYKTWDTTFSITNVGIWALGPGGYHPEGTPPYHATFGGTFGNGGAGTDYELIVGQQLGTRINWEFTATITNNVPGAVGPCTRLAPEATMGSNCLRPHDTANQVLAVDPINTATGNFHENFVDFAVPGRGPGLMFSHSYNSLRAAKDGPLPNTQFPLGYGWTFSYGVALAVDDVAIPNTVTVTQESGAQETFYKNSAGLYEASPGVLATLTKNPDGTYTFVHCNRITMVFSPARKLTSITDRNGYSTTLQYVADKLDTIIDRSVTDTAKRTLKVIWTGSRITEVRDSSSPEPRKVSFGYDSAGDLRDYTDLAGGKWHFTYSGHLLKTIRRPKQAGAASPKVTTNVYDPQARVTSQTDELQRPTLFDYTSISGATKVTDPKNNVVVYGYTGYRPTYITRGWQSPVQATWKFVTNDLGAVTKATDPNQHEVNSLYDDRGNLTWTKDALGRELRADYNQFDQPLTVTNPDNVTTKYVYDAKGNLEKVSVLAGEVVLRATSFGYDPARPGDLTTITDPISEVWRRGYDGFGNVSDETDPLFNKTKYGFDEPTGYLKTVVSPRGVAAGVGTTCAPPALGCAKFKLDAYGRVLEATDANSKTSVRHFDPNGNLDYQIDANINRTEFFYTVADELERVHRADGLDLKTAYWPDGSIKETRDGASQPTAYDYDAQGRLSTVKDPLQRTTTYRYDPAGNPTAKFDHGGSCPGSACTAMTYDAGDQLKTITYGSGSPLPVSIGYDNLGRRNLMTDGSGTNQWKWDALGRLEWARDGADKLLSYGYANPRDPATTITYPGVGDVTRVFDKAGRMKELKDWQGNLTKFEPDADSNIATVTRPIGTGLVDTIKFDNADQLIGITDKKGAATVASFDYGAGDGGPEGARDNAGQVTAVSSTGLNDSHSYGYDKLNQLKTVDTGTYSYDPADNLKSTPSGQTMDYDVANQLTTLTKATNPTAFAFDSRGNRTSTTPKVGTAQTYTYDQANRLASTDTTTYNASVSVGWYHSLAAKSDGSVSAWGYNGLGQLGNNTTTDLAVPAAVPGLTGVVGVAGGSYQSAALKADGTVWAWGWNAVGQLGNNSTVDSKVPVQVQGLSGVKAIAAGTSHFLALKADGTVWTWGYNSNGQIGNNTTTDALVPVQVQGLSGVTAITGGYTSSVALKGDGTVWAWGYNGYGQLGNNTTTDSKLPVQVQGLSGVAAISAGYHHVVAVKGDSSVWSWGYNAFGQLGNNSTVDTKLPVQIAGLTGVSSVAAAGYHSTALRADGSVATWGWNGFGQLANGTTTSSQVPQAAAALAGTKALAAGPTNGLALRTGGAAVAWGSNAARTVGDGTTIDRLAPVTITYSRGSTPMASYVYNGNGLRTKKTVAGVTIAFTWDISSGLPLLVDDGTNYYIYGPGGQPLEHIDRAGVVTWYHQDQLGSTRLLTNSTGATVGTATYDPYGRLTASTGKLSPIGFAGEYTDAETGFVYLRARYYDPWTGQFLARDPLAPLTRSPYAYVNGNPLNAIDPTGLFGIPGTNWCVDIGDPSCRSIAESHGEGAQQVADFAGGVLDGVTFGNGQELLTSGQESKVRWGSDTNRTGVAIGWAATVPFLLEYPVAFSKLSSLSSAEAAITQCANGFDSDCAFQVLVSGTSILAPIALQRALFGSYYVNAIMSFMLTPLTWMPGFYQSVYFCES